MMNEIKQDDDKDLILGFSPTCPDKFHSETYFTNAYFEGAFNTLREGLRQQPGQLLVLTGEAGIGKTLLLHKLLDSAADAVEIIFCPRTDLDFEQLLAFISERLQLPPRPDRSGNLKALSDYLTLSTRQGRRTVLIIDDAHQLHEDILEHLLTLGQDGFDEQHSLQMLLSGLPVLKRRLLQQRSHYPFIGTAVFARLLPLSDVEVPVFINCQLQAPNNPYDMVFPAAAIERVSHHSRGVPGLINTLCQEALKAARSTGEKRVTADSIDAAAGRLLLDETLETVKPVQPLIPARTAAPVAQIQHGNDLPVIAPAAIAAMPQPVTAAPLRWSVPMLLLLGVLAGATGGIGSILLYENAATIKAKIAGAGDSLLPRQNQADPAPAFLLAEDGTTAQENHAAADTEDSTAVTASVTAAEPPAPAAADAPPAPEPPAPLAADISPAPAPEPQPEPQPEKTPDPAVIQKMASLINTIRTKLPVLPSLESLPRDSAALGPAPAPAPAPPAADTPVAAADSPVVAADPGPSVADTAIDSDFYVQRGNDMLDLGDVASARLFYQAGAKAGAINCLTAIGLTYDPLALEQRGLTAIYADSKLAIQWYEKAIQAGDQQASERLSKLRTWLADVAAITAPAAPSRY